VLPILGTRVVWLDDSNTRASGRVSRLGRTSQQSLLLLAPMPSGNLIVHSDRGDGYDDHSDYEADPYLAQLHPSSGMAADVLSLPAAFLSALSFGAGIQTGVGASAGPRAG